MHTRMVAHTAACAGRVCMQPQLQRGQAAGSQSAVCQCPTHPPRFCTQGDVFVDRMPRELQPEKPGKVGGLAACYGGHRRRCS